MTIAMIRQSNYMIPERCLYDTRSYARQYICTFQLASTLSSYSVDMRPYTESSKGISNKLIHPFGYLSLQSSSPPCDSQWSRCPTCSISSFSQWSMQPNHHPLYCDGVSIILPVLLHTMQNTSYSTSRHILEMRQAMYSFVRRRGEVHVYLLSSSLQWGRHLTPCLFFTMKYTPYSQSPSYNVVSITMYSLSPYCYEVGIVMYSFSPPYNV